VTQLDLPQVSLQRYVDLVRRRRWQLLPVSLLGLLVGGVVAFLIPRYYVAEAVIEHDSIPGEFRTPGEDPFRRIVQNAQQGIPYAAGKAMERLKWPEALLADASERTAAEKEVRSRIAVYDTNAGEKERDNAVIRVVYRDQDGTRAAALANALGETFVEEKVTKLRKTHEEQLQHANDEVTRWSETYDRLLSAKRALEERYNIRPGLDPGWQMAQLQLLRKEQATRLELHRSKDGERAALANQIQKDQEKLATLKERVKPGQAELMVAAAGNVQVLAFVQQLQHERDGLDVLDPKTPLYRQAEYALRWRQRLVMRMLAVDLDEQGLMANPAYLELTRKLEVAIPALQKLEYEVASLAKEIAADQAESGELPRGFEEIERKRKDLSTAEFNRNDALARQKTHSEQLTALQARLPVNLIHRAQPPPHPTDPNIFVVALIGAVLGLGVAVGLILLLDMLQGSFKTADDVERGLGVPVLGGVSHLETEDERQTVTRGRRRAAAAAFAFVALVVVVVTIYYRAPTRLPAVVRDLLSMLLGS
jgi:capsular polysaccharide biosynthesis protein